MKINLIEFEFNRNINISYIGTSHEIQNIIIISTYYYYILSIIIYYYS